MPQRQKPSFNARLLFPAIVGAYILLDWVSHIHPYHHLNITPWSPAAGLALSFLMYRPRAGAATLFVAIALAELLIRQGLPGWSTALLTALALTLGYSCLAAWLRHRFPACRPFCNRGGFVVWIASILLGTLLNSFAFITIMQIAGLIPIDAWSGAAIRHWIGDMVGIVVFMPLFWLLAARRDRALLRQEVLTWETLGYIGLALIIVLAGSGLGPEGSAKHFYFLFLPVIWAASRQGLAGAAISAVAVQLMIIMAVESLGFQELPVFEVQLLAFVLAGVGFFMGVTIEEHRQISLRLHQTLRLAAAGEMTAALAHELNQPLTALNAYGSACEQLVARGETGPVLTGAIRRMLEESKRAGEVLRRLRDFFRTGSTRLELTELDRVLACAAQTLQAKAAAEKAEIVLPPPSGLVILADSLQLEVVLRNLLANALDAVSGDQEGGRRVTIRIDRGDSKQALITVEDSGPGVSEELAERLFQPFVSTKPAGLGIGLAISRDIVEGHGGKLWVEPGNHGVMKLTLPYEESDPSAR